MPAKTVVDSGLLASELRLEIGRLVRRLRAEQGFPVHHLAVLGRLDREGPQSIGDLARAERVRPQSMAQTVADLEAEGLLSRTPDPTDRRRAIVALTDQGLAALLAQRRQREGWLAHVIEEDLSERERELLSEAAVLIRRLAES
jgi:DNA-binding MarR family transcriptional regulator